MEVRTGTRTAGAIVQSTAALSGYLRETEAPPSGASAA
jgi:hypothetical protein